MQKVIISEQNKAHCLKLHTLHDSACSPTSKTIPFIEHDLQSIDLQDTIAEHATKLLKFKVLYQ